MNRDGADSPVGSPRTVGYTGLPMTLLERYDRLLNRLRAELQAHYGPRLVACAVYGSVGRLTPRHDSDVDFIVVARELPDGRSRRLDEFLAVEARLQPDLRVPNTPGGEIWLSPVFKTPQEVEAGSPLFLDMVEDARILYDAEGFLARYLDGLRARLRVLGARRIWRGNAWYWDLKPDFQPGDIIHL
jgi:predicted nucleotidyltransferase